MRGGAGGPILAVGKGGVYAIWRRRQPGIIAPALNMNRVMGSPSKLYEGSGSLIQGTDCSRNEGDPVSRVCMENFSS